MKNRKLLSDKKRCIKEWNRLWKPLLHVDHDDEMVWSQLNDLVIVLGQLSSIYTEIVGRDLTNPLLYADHIRNAFAEEVDHAYKHGFQDGKEELHDA